VERDGRLVLVRRVDARRHELHYPEPAWGIDAGVLAEAQARGAGTVEVVDRETGNTWWSPIGYMLARGTRLDRGFGRQVALPLTHWSFMPGERGQGGQRSLLN